MNDVYILSAVRTPIGRFGGGLKDCSPSDLASHAMKAALEQAGLNGSELDLYIFGNVLRAGHGQLIPRQGAIKAGIPETVDGYAVDMVCSSGMLSILNAATAIRAGEADLVLAGGTESMSQAGFLLSHRARWGYKFLLGAPENLMDILEYDGLTDPILGEGMGLETERLTADCEVSREELDEVAFLSQNRAVDARNSGQLAAEITPITIKTRKGDLIVDTDEGIREGTTLESLSSLRPAFSKEGVLTAGNASQISDGAAGLVVASQKAVDEYGLQPLARILGGSWAAGPSWRFPEAPIPAVKKLMARLGMSIPDFDLIENNEAFALNSILFAREFNLSYDILNVNGGAIALGHPIGASGARIVVTLMNALKQHEKTFGLAAICHGTGGATAIAIERIN